MLVSVAKLCCSTKMNSQFNNWSDLRVFLAVCRSGSTLAASKVLGMAQPTVARRIDALEHELGLTLFDRDTRGFRPTQHGFALLPKAEAVEAAANTLRDAASSLAAARPIRLTFFSANMSARVVEIFNEFAEVHPEIEFRFLSSSAVLDLMKGEADVAMRISRSPQHPDLIQRKISTAQFTLFGSKSYADRYGLPASPDDLAGHRFVTFVREDISNALHDWLVARVTPDQILATFHEIELAHAAISSGRGLGIVNLRMAESLPELVPCFPPIEVLSAQHEILISPEAYRRPEVRTFVQFFAPRYAALYK